MNKLGFICVGLSAFALAVLVVVSLSGTESMATPTGAAVSVGTDQKPSNPDFTKNIILTYCPTMEPIAQRIAGINSNIILAKKGSASEVFKSLRSGEVELGLVGRLAKYSELQPAYVKQLGEGHTLVSSSKKFVDRRKLTGMEVHTALDRDIVESYIQDSQIIYYTSSEEAVFNGLAEAVLIDWEDYEDSMELVVVMDSGGKAEEFRLPVLYSMDYDLALLEV
jgi:hypothetical protein